MPRRAKKEKEEKEGFKCRFPCGAVLVLIIGVLWLLQDLKVLAWNVPWLPILVILVALKMMVMKSMMHKHWEEMKK